MPHIKTQTQLHKLEMVYTKRFIECNWLRHKPVTRYQQWYQSACFDPWRSQLHRNSQYAPNKFYLQRQTDPNTSNLPRHKKYISPEAKHMLKKKVEEVVSYNSSKLKHLIGSSYKQIGEPNDLSKKDKRARCYICKKRGHVFWKCTDKGKETKSGKME